MQVDDAAKSGRPMEAAEVRVQLEAHGQTVAKWLARAAKLLERVQGLRLRSESPGEGSPTHIPRTQRASTVCGTGTLLLHVGRTGASIAAWA